MRRPGRGRPNANFPSYSFSVRRGGGFNLAIPVQGVPIGLSLMGGDAAQGSVVIAGARTYGVDTMTLFDAVDAWARGQRGFLSNYEPQDNKQNYLRVVSRVRVYLTGRVNVSLSSSRAGSGGLSAGAAKPVDVLVPSADPEVQKRTLEAFQANLKSLNSMLDESLKKITIGEKISFCPAAS